MENKDKEIRITEDGSHTIYLPESGESYHSMFGAINESLHVFIEAGLNFITEKKKKVHILEVGLGTGLNLMLTVEQAEKMGIEVDYLALEPFPVELTLVRQLNFPEITGLENDKGLLEKIHQSGWGEKVTLNSRFHFMKFRERLEDYHHQGDRIDLIYFDAFSPAVQPELWEPSIFVKLAGMTNPGGVLVTYSAKGQVRRNLQAAGFSVERLPGPAGKREMLRGVRN